MIYRRLDSWLFGSSEAGVGERAAIGDCGQVTLEAINASWGSWTVSWDDDRTQELASGASSTKTRTQFGYPNFVQHPKTLQFQRCYFNV